MLRGYFHGGRPYPQAGDQKVENVGAIDQDDAAVPDDSADEERYRLVSIDAAHAPAGCTGEDWFVYRIVQGGNGITGYRCGNLKRVSAEVQSIVTALNGRRQWTKITSTSKSQRRAAAAARRRAAK